MSSWIVCDCGRHIHKNLFAGAHVRVALDEEVLDRDFEGRSAEDLVDELLLKCDLMLTCADCGRLYLVDESGGRPVRAFTPVG
jgi:hypothetical protein